MKLFSLCYPPILSNLLVTGDDDVPTRPRCQVTNHRRLNINLGFRHDTSLADLALTWLGMSRSNIRDERRGQPFDSGTTLHEATRRDSWLYATRRERPRPLDPDVMRHKPTHGALLKLISRLAIVNDGTRLLPRTKNQSRDFGSFNCRLI